MSRLKSIESDMIFKITADLITNLSRTLSMHEHNDKKNLGQQNVWNFAPSVHSKCMLMDIICLILNQTQDVL